MYNGWSNYETWNVALWIGNNEGDYRYWREETRKAIEEGTDAVRKLSDQLRDEIEDGNPLSHQASLYSDILMMNLREVNYYEIASLWIEEAKAEEERETEEPIKISP